MASPSKIFISYRREDSAHFANFLRYKLSEEFGKDRIFLDVSQLRAGQRFDEALKEALEESDVFLAIIGPKWHDLLLKREGQEDFVRQEISNALGRKMVIIPILVDDIEMPESGRLPSDMRDLVRFQARRYNHESAEQDVGSLIAEIKDARTRLHSRLERARRAERVGSYGFPKGGRIALVIGNSAYVSTAPLQNAVDDAALVTRRLKLLGYEVIGGASVARCATGQNEGVNLTRQATLELLAKLRAKIQPGAGVVIYYAGAAIQVGDRIYLSPVDFDMDSTLSQFGLIDFSFVIERIAEFGGKQGVVVAFWDACRDDPLPRDQSRRSLSVVPDDIRNIFKGEGEDDRPPERGLASFRLLTPLERARTFMGFATASGGLAYDGKADARNSPFALALDHQLAIRGLEIEELFRRVTSDVRDLVNLDLGRHQEPTRESNLDRSFYIYPSTASPVAVLGLLGGLAGLLISMLLISDIGLIRTDANWVWGLGALFGCVAAFGTALWGSGKTIDVVLALVWPIIGLAAALSLIKSVPSIAAATIAAPIDPQVGNVFFVSLLAGSTLFLATSAGLAVTRGRERIVGTLGWLNRLIVWVTPFAVLAVMLRLYQGVASGSPAFVAATLLVTLSTVIYATSPAMGCRTQGGIFAGFPPGVGGAAVGLLSVAFFSAYASLAFNFTLSPSGSKLALISLITLWHGLLGAQLGYCFSYYVPDHRRIAG